MLRPELIARDPMHDRIYARLREALIYGEFEEGQAVSLREIARLFGVSITPARDALKRLVWEGGIDHLPNGTFCVPTLGIAEVEDLREQSKFYEGLLIRKVADRLTGPC